MGFSIALSAGEASGDLNGAHLAAELKKIRSDLHIWGCGGTKMREAGVDIPVDMTGGGTIGICETLKTLPEVAGKYLKMRRELLLRRPDLFVPIDFGAFNIRLAQIAHKNGIPVVYYFPPSSWRRRPKNAAKLLACGGRVITPFPWSADLLSASGIDARFVGHPLVDIVKSSVTRAEFYREVGLAESRPTIGLLPGSRGHEIREHLKPMIGAAEIISRELGGAQFIVGAAGKAESLKQAIETEARGKEDFPAIHVLERRTYDCMAHSDFLISASGTATLETALLGTPMIIIYRGSAIMRFEYLFRKAILEDYIGLPNIVADRGICPELINDDVVPEKLADITISFMKSPDLMNNMRASLADVRKELGESGAIQRVAKTLLEMEGLK